MSLALRALPVSVPESKITAQCIAGAEPGPPQWESPGACVPRVPVSFRARKARAALALCKVWVAALQLWVYLKGFFCVAFLHDMLTIGNLNEPVKLTNNYARNC